MKKTVLLICVLVALPVKASAEFNPTGLEMLFAGAGLFCAFALGRLLFVDSRALLSKKPVAFSRQQNRVEDEEPYTSIKLSFDPNKKPAKSILRAHLPVKTQGKKRRIYFNGDIINNEGKTSRNRSKDHLPPVPERENFTVDLDTANVRVVAAPHLTIPVTRRP